MALHQPVTSSQPPDEPLGLIAIASKAPARVTLVGLQGQAGREFTVGYLPHEVAAAGRIVFASNYGSAHVRSSELANTPGNTLSAIDRHARPALRRPSISEPVAVRRTALRCRAISDGFMSRARDVRKYW